MTTPHANMQTAWAALANKASMTYLTGVPDVEGDTANTVEKVVNATNSDMSKFATAAQEMSDISGTVVDAETKLLAAPTQDEIDTLQADIQADAKSGNDYSDKTKLLKDMIQQRKDALDGYTTALSEANSKAENVEFPEVTKLSGGDDESKTSDGEDEGKSKDDESKTSDGEDNSKTSDGGDDENSKTADNEDRSKTADPSQSSGNTSQLTGPQDHAKGIQDAAEAGDPEHKSTVDQQIEQQNEVASNNDVEARKGELIDAAGQADPLPDTKELTPESMEPIEAQQSEVSNIMGDRKLSSEDNTVEIPITPGDPPVSRWHPPGWAPSPADINVTQPIPTYKR